MYRQYEDPRGLEEQLRQLEIRADRLMEMGLMDEDAWIQYQQDSAELRDRINFAWQDEEYDLNCACYDF